MRVSIEFTATNSIHIVLPEACWHGETPVCLHSQAPLNEAQYEQLIHFLLEHQGSIQLKQLILLVNDENIPCPGFFALLRALQTSTIARVDLLGNLTHQESLNCIATLATYPVFINAPHQKENPPELQAFTQHNIRTIRQYHQEKCLGFADINNAPDAVNAPAIDKEHHLYDDDYRRLQHLLGPQHAPLAVEVHHIAQHEIQAVAQHVHQHEIQEQQEQQAVYHGELVDWEQFIREPYQTWFEDALRVQRTAAVMLDNDSGPAEHFKDAIQDEFFGTLTQSIRYLSPQAAEMIAKHPFDFSALNHQYLPTHFALRHHTDAFGSPTLILDYDPGLAPSPRHPFRPEKTRLNQVSECLYPSNHVPVALERRLRAHHLLREHQEASSSGLHPLWIKYGELVITLWLDRLEAIEVKPPGFILSIMGPSLYHLNDWSLLFDEPGLLDALTSLHHYSTEKMACLRHFFTDHHGARHAFHLQAILKGFDHFWDEWTSWASAQHVDPNTLSLHPWQTPCIGQPVVYMERLLRILKRSRHLTEQLNTLGGFSFLTWSVDTGQSLEDVVKAMDQNYPSIIQYHQQFYLYAPTQGECTPLPNRLGDLDLNTLPMKTPQQGWFNTTAWLHTLTHQTWKNLWTLVGFDAQYAPLYQYFYALGLTHPQLSLEKYGAYHASENEGFLVVAPEQALHVPRRGSFRPRRERTYHVAIQELLSPDVEVHDGYRFIAQQAQSVRLNEYILGVNAFLKRRQDMRQCLQDELSPDLRESLGALHFTRQSFHRYHDVFFMSWLLVAHERYHPSPGLSIEALLNELTVIYGDDFDPIPDAQVPCLSSASRSQSLGITQGVSMQTKLCQLFTQGIRLNAQEGLIFYDNFKSIQRQERQTRNDIQQVRLLHALTHNGVGTLNYLHFLSQDVVRNLSKKTVVALIDSNAIWAVGSQMAFSTVQSTLSQSILFALDTADFLKANRPQLALYYREDLLLFSALMNTPAFNDAEAPIDFNRYCATETNPQRQEKEAELAQVRDILQHTIDSPHPNNLSCAFKAIMHSKKTFTRRQWIDAATQIQRLPEYNPSHVIDLLTEHDFELHAPTLSPFVSQACTKELLIQLISTLKPEAASLHDMSTPALQALLHQVWQEQGLLAGLIANQALLQVLSQLKTAIIEGALNTLPEGDFRTLLHTKISQLSDFQATHDLDAIEHIRRQSTNLVTLWSTLMQRDNFYAHEASIIALLAPFSWENYTSHTMVLLLEALVDMPQRDYTGILSTFFQESQQKSEPFCVQLITTMTRFHQQNFSSEHICRVLQVYSHDANDHLFAIMQTELLSHGPNDPIGTWLLDMAGLNVQIIGHFLTQTRDIVNEHRQHVCNLLMHMSPAHQNTLLSFEGHAHVIEILSMSFSSTSSHALEQQSIHYAELLTELNTLSDEQRTALHAFLSTHPVSLPCLEKNLFARNRHQPWDAFLHEFEKAPFGPRPFEEQFSTAEVERVVNNFIDLNQNTVYPYEYRIKMMEAFLFINQAGYDLPLYDHQPARDLSNVQITQLFQAIKAGAFNESLTPWMRRLYALGLLREAMYRTTGEFPFSTQMLGIIDCMMHSGDVVSNIDTGQGKSLTDSMKAALLWLEPGEVGVDITTSSLVDAQRDAKRYHLFFNLLAIPHALDAISNHSSYDDYVRKGINRSTMAQFSLLYNRAQTDGVTLHGEQLSWVGNESDDTMLDDNTIYRFALTGGPGMFSEEHDWIYDAVNDFVTHELLLLTRTLSPTMPHAQQREQFKQQAINALKNKLKNRATLLNKNHQRLWIDQIKESKLWTLIKSGLMVNDPQKMQENTHYVLTLQPESKCIHGRNQMTRSAKVLMSNDKVSPDNVFGEFIQQLLYAKLNQEYGPKTFVIEPESKTILSSNSKNAIDFYRSKRGFFWGSSGTVGSANERRLLQQKYGVDFSAVPSHQTQQVTMAAEPQITPHQEAHFNAILTQIQSRYWFESLWCEPRPVVIFMKDIENVHAFYAYLDAHVDGPKQKYTGLGDEPTIIQHAATPGMITVTTSALGRNTDILYNHHVGMDLIIGSIGSWRADMQKQGRTGRQGSKGHITYILNQEDFPDGITPTRLQIEERARYEREHNEEFYTILGSLRAHIGPQPKEFFINRWSTWSAEKEAMYRESIINHHYDRDAFIEHLVTDFNALVQKNITSNEVRAALMAQYAEKPPVPTHGKPVTRSDCVPPEIIAQHVIADLNPALFNAPMNRALIKNNIHALLRAIGQAEQHETHRQYLRALQDNPLRPNTLRALHHECLIEYFGLLHQRHVESWSITRWLGFTGPLQQLMQEDQFLLLFRAWMAVDNNQPNDDLFPTVQQASIQLLTEYLEYSWFISPYKQQATRDLIADIRQQTNCADLMTVLHDTKVRVFEQDVATNQNEWLRTLKPVNQWGSRFQQVVDRAMALTLQHQTEHLPPLDPLHALHEQDGDQCNARVIANSMEKMRLFACVKTTLEQTQGMQGRIPGANRSV